MADLPDTVGAADLAGLLGLSANRVSVLAAGGVIKKKGRGCYLLAASSQGYAEWVRQNPAGRRRGASDEKDRLTAAQADLAELKLAQTRGDLLPLEDVRKEWAAIAIDLRATSFHPPTSGSCSWLQTSSRHRSVAAWDRHRGRASMAAFRHGRERGA